MQFSEMVSRVSENLRDFPEFRWSETQIKRYINDGYREFVNRAHCLVKHTNITITEDTALYDVPTDNLTINRVSWKELVLAIRTTREMDGRYMAMYDGISSGTKWKEVTGTDIKAIVQDFEGYDQFRVYPMIDLASSIGGLVIGTDSSVYKCIKAHTAAAANKPVTGADYATYWEVTTTNGSGVAWATGTAYKKYYNLILDHSYMPAVLSANSDEPAYPARFHKGLVDYAIGECITNQLGIEKDMVEAKIYYNRFEAYIERCRGEVARGFNTYRPRQVVTRSFT